jgi:penicillin-binding protein 1C
MGYLHKTRPSRAPKPPADMVQARVNFADDLHTVAMGSNSGSSEVETYREAARQEWFIEGTQQSSFALRDAVTDAAKAGAGGNTAASRITAPASGTIIALDPDIPPNRQRLSFAAQGVPARWLMDGKEFAKGPQAQWMPWPGRHVVTLADAKGQTLDQIRIEVRGAGVVKR